MIEDRGEVRGSEREGAEWVIGMLLCEPRGVSMLVKYCVSEVSTRTRPTGPAVGV